MRSPWAPAILIALMAVTGAGLAHRTIDRARRRADEAEARARDAETARAAAERIQTATAKDLQSRVEALQKQVADLEAAGRGREGELMAARADLERLRRGAEDEVRRREAAEQEAGRLRKALEAAAAPPPPPAPVVVETGIEKPAPPAPGLGPTAVTDRRQVAKLVEGLNALLAGVGGAEAWTVASAEAVEDDRLLRVALWARNPQGDVTKTFQAGEARFVLQAAAGTLSIRLKDGSVTYPGKRSIPFPEGAYTVLLVVDPAPFRTSGNPLVSIP